jgi:ATP-dependent DNA helicase RecG
MKLTQIAGVGDARAKLFAKLGVETIEQAAHHYPHRHDDRTAAVAINDLIPGEKGCCFGRTTSKPATFKGGNRTLTKIEFRDQTGTAELVWYGQAFQAQAIREGSTLFVRGKVNRYQGKTTIDMPEIEYIGEEDNKLPGTIVPVYYLTEGLSQNVARKTIQAALGYHVPGIEETLPAAVLDEYDLMDRRQAIHQIHRPASQENLARAIYRLKFEELYWPQVEIAKCRQIAAAGLVHCLEDAAVRSFVQSLPYTLTGAQRRVMTEIRRDLAAGTPMNRLLHGDVGSGKTVVAAFALWTAAKAGHQGALMAPTELLAEQHYASFKHLLERLGLNVGILTSSLSGPERVKFVNDLCANRINVMVGTQAIIQKTITFANLGVVVVDEQHRFGVDQRAELVSKGAEGKAPDVLHMTATPIPQTLALTAYGDLDISVLDELPPGRQQIKTVHLLPAHREKAYGQIRAEVKKGRQAYVVCPLVATSAKMGELKAVTALAGELRLTLLEGLRIGVVHGQQSSQERESEMEMFRAGMYDVLVSTTVIEVGVDVPNASFMLIEDADRFGLSQLHQLRGRVGRGAHKSFCALIADPQTDDGRARMKAMVRTQNGFEIAEEDLALRGAGEFHGTKQSGNSGLKLANLVTDVAIIRAARDAAQAGIRR